MNGYNDELATARRTVDEGYSLNDAYLQTKIALATCREPPMVIWAVSGIEQLLSRQYEVHRRGRRAEIGTVPTPRYTAIFRDIFGNPFRPATLEPSSRTPTVTALAAQMYGSRDFTPMPILGDALEDAGCSDAEVLSHCRGDGPHVWGCWVVDRVLGKS